MRIIFKIIYKVGVYFFEYLGILFLSKLIMNSKINPTNNKCNLVSGGAGFLGSHLIDKLMQKGEKVICLDNYFTGDKSNIAKWLNHPNFEIIRHDVTEPIQLEVDKIWHLACPASPVHYQSNPIKTAKKITCDMLFEKNNTVFIEWFENLESYCQQLIFKKSKDWFQDEIELDDIESAFFCFVLLLKC